MALACEVSDLPRYRQKKHNWCWAACAQTILECNGIDYEQADIVEHRYPGQGSPNKPGFPRFDKAGLKYFTVACKPLDRPDFEAEFCADPRRPVMIAANDHMVVGYGITADSRWELRIHDPSDPGWRRWSRNSYRAEQPITYYQFGVAAQEGPKEDGDDYCDRQREAVAVETWTRAEVTRALDDEIATVVRLFLTDHPKEAAEGQWKVEPPLRMYRLAGPGRVRLNRVLYPFRLDDRWGGAIAVRWYGGDRWAPFSAEVSDFAKVAIAVAGGRRRRGAPVDILERVQGLYDWIRVKDEEADFEGSEPLDIRPELRRDDS